MTKKLFLAIVTLLLAACTISLAQTLTTLKHQPPDGAGVPFLLTDGTVMVQGNIGNDWWKLTPDINGSYVNGTWTQTGKPRLLDTSLMQWLRKFWPTAGC